MKKNLIGGSCLIMAAMGMVPSLAAGDTLYVAEEQLTRVSLAQPNGASPQPFASGVGLVYGLAADSGGNLYVAAAGNDIIWKINPSGAASVFASSSSLGSPDGMAFDAAGNLYVAGRGYGGVINKISPNGTLTRFASDVGGWGLAIDRSGNIYSEAGNSIDKITSAGVVSLFASGFNDPNGLAFDRNGNLFVANYLGDTISKVTPGGVVSLFANGMDRPTGLAFDGSGDLLVANITENHPLGYIDEITPDGAVSGFAGGFDYPTAILDVPEPSAICLIVCGLLALAAPAAVKRSKNGWKLPVI